MIVRDAAETVATSLESIRDVADEIVVVDTGSTDGTRQIALPRASRLLDFEWCEDFAAARNFGLDHATGDWVLWLDAGETLSRDAAAALRTLVDAQTDNERAFLVMVQAPAANHEMAAEQVGRIRLHPLRSGIEFTGRLREEIETAIEAIGMSVELAPFSIARSRRDHDPLIKRRRAERDVHLAALEIQQHGVLPSPLLAMADACVVLGHLSEGIEFYSRALELAPSGSTAMLEAFYGVLAALDQVPQARAKQLALCEKALTIFPTDAQLLSAMGSYLQLQGRIDLACRSFEAAARFGQINPQVWHLVEIADAAIGCYATCQDLLGDIEGARRTLEAAAGEKPQSERLRRQLLDLYIRHELRREALDLVGRFPPDTPHREALRSAVRGACLAAKQNWIPALAYLQTAMGSGCRDVICWRGLLNAYLATGDLAAAEQTLHAWRLHHPANAEIRRFAAALARLRQPPTAGRPESAPSSVEADQRFRVDMEQQVPAPSLPMSVSYLWPQFGARARVD
jgi:tetratricopeptide (TPR) repeat protein